MSLSRMRHLSRLGHRTISGKLSDNRTVPSNRSHALRHIDRIRS
jgi:hypothetical protein